MAVVAGLAVVIGPAAALLLRSGDGSRTEAQPPITSRAEGCHRFVSLDLEIVSKHLGDDQAAPKLRGYEAAVRGVDEAAADDVAAVLRATTKEEVSSTERRLLLRCVQDGYLTRGDLAPLITAGQLASD
ncbi:hypothetical protein CLV35_2683 [Motilibacter peucedani]|uniref:Uncharacterized protein n=1 Tax=Motilibacter peucedani TaxID=598650 RepID=A0A420XM46_9ACTN|nr:hypothetical protein [Motilibacter peucedani]RKS72439.1 hypothetical protein CLV35_2683 [Motilibacter peucedani]